MSVLALSDSFEYLCYGSTASINIFTLSVRGSTWTSESDVCRRQILTCKVDPCAVRVNVTCCQSYVRVRDLPPLHPARHEAVIGMICVIIV